MIIDIHTHTFTDELAPRAIEKLSQGGRFTAYTDGTCSGLRESQKRAGIDISVIMPIATKPSQARNINQWAADINRRYDDLICFGTLHPLQDDWQEEIDRLVADNIRGIKLHPDYQLFFVDDPSMFPMYRALADAGLILLFHAGVDIGLPPPVHCPPERLAKALDAAPNLTVIAAHMGGYLQWEEVDKYLAGSNLYFDTSFSLADLGAERMAALIEAHGPDRILFGTDSPWTDQQSEVEGIRSLSLSDEEKIAVLGGNTVRLLKLG